MNKRWLGWQTVCAGLLLGGWAVAAAPATGIFGDGSFKMTSSELGAGGKMLTAAGHLLLLLDAAKAAGTASGQLVEGDYSGATLTAGSFAAKTWATLKIMGYAQNGLTAYAPSVAAYLPAVMAGVISFGLTSELLEGIKTADGQTLNQHIQNAMASYAQEFEQVDIEGTLAEAEKQKILIGMVKSGFFEIKNGMTMSEAWQALSAGKALKEVLKPTYVVATPPPTVSATDAKQAAWEKAVTSGQLKSDEYKKFEAGYNAAKGTYTPPKNWQEPDKPKTVASAEPAGSVVAKAEPDDKDQLCKRYDDFSIKEGVALYVTASGTPYLRIYPNRKFSGPYRVQKLDRPVMIDGRPVGGTLDLPVPPPNISFAQASVSDWGDYLRGPWVFKEITPPGSAKPGFAYVNAKGTRAWFNVEKHAGTAQGTSLQVSYEVMVPGPGGQPPPPWSVHGLWPATPLVLDRSTKPLATVISSGGPTAAETKPAAAAPDMTRSEQIGVPLRATPAAGVPPSISSGPTASGRDDEYAKAIAAALGKQPPPTAPLPTVPARKTSDYAREVEKALSAIRDIPSPRPATHPASALVPAPPRPAVSSPARVPAAPLPPSTPNANVVGAWSRIDTTANFRETLTLNAGGAGTHTITMLDAFIHSRVGAKSAPLSYSIKGNQVTINLPGGSATGTVNGNVLTVGNKTFRR